MKGRSQELFLFCENISIECCDISIEYERISIESQLIFIESTNISPKKDLRTSFTLDEFV